MEIMMYMLAYENIRMNITVIGKKGIHNFKLDIYSFHVHVHEGTSNFQVKLS